jgi:hypothetical protein
MSLISGQRKAIGTSLSGSAGTWRRQETSPAAPSARHCGATKERERPDGLYYREGLHLGDHLHPNAEGGRLLADAYDLEQLTGRAIAQKKYAGAVPGTDADKEHPGKKQPAGNKRSTAKSGEKTFHAFEIIDEEGREAAQEALGAFMQAHLAE